MGGRTRLGPLFPRLGGVLPEYQLWPALSWLDWEFGLALTPLLLFHALVIAAFASLETLLCVRLLQSARHTRMDSDRELSAQGLANLACGLVGGTVTGAALPRCRAMLDAGGRGPLGALAFALFLGLLVGLGGELVSTIPWSVAAGLLLYLAWTMVDAGTRRILCDVALLWKGRARQPASTLADLAVVLLVAATAVLGNILLAAALGMVGAMALFTLSNIRPLVRRSIDGRTCRSCTVRSSAADRSLFEQGERLLLLELQGVLFFGTAEQLAARLQSLPPRVQYVVLELEHLSYVDSSGAHLLSEMALMLLAQGRSLLLCGARPALQGILRSRLPMTAGLSWHADRDQALLTVETILLEEAGCKAQPARLTLAQTVLARGLSARETDFLSAFVKHGKLERAGILFRCGDEGDSLLVSADRHVDIVLSLPDGRRRRICSVAPGVPFGEMALLEQQCRSADAQVDGPVHYWELTRQGLLALGAAHPSIAFRVLTNLGIELSARLRSTTRELRLAHAPQGDWP